MNKSGDKNRSVRNTKRRLREALLTLLQKKPVNEISVKELSELADVNRGTFYFHYSDVYDMLYQIETVLNSSELEYKMDIHRSLVKIFSFLGENHNMCSIFFSENNDMKFFNKIKALVNEHLCSLWKHTDITLNEVRMDMYNAFIVNGCAGIMQRWLADGLKETPDEIAVLVSSIINGILKNGLSLHI